MDYQESDERLTTVKCYYCQENISNVERCAILQGSHTKRYPPKRYFLCDFCYNYIVNEMNDMRWKSRIAALKVVYPANLGYQTDLDDKIFVLQILRNEFGIRGSIGVELVLPDGRKRYPDILLRDRKIIIELDGQSHGHPDSPTPQTIRRNMDYVSLDFKLAVVHKTGDGYEKEDVIESLEAVGLLRGEQICS